MDKNLTPCLVIQKNQFKATPSPYSQTFKRFNSLNSSQNLNFLHNSKKKTHFFQTKVTKTFENTKKITHHTLIHTMPNHIHLIV